MRHVLMAAGVLCALMLSPAIAQDRHPHGGGGPHEAPHASSHMGGSSRMGSFRSGPEMRSAHTHRTVHVHPHGSTTARRTTTVSRSHHAGMRNVSLSRHMRPAGTHRHIANVRALRRNFTAPRRFHHGAYVRPAGWYPHRWVYGESLPSGWYGQNYWIVNFSFFGLIYPPYGYEWIRVGDDALLVDIDTGVILRVEYGVFY